MKKAIYLSWFACALFAFMGSAVAQNNRHWEIATGDLPIPKSQLMLGQLPDAYRFAVLDVPALYQELSATSRAQPDAAPTLISIPTPEGNFAEFYITETSVVSPEVAHLYTIKTFKGYAKNSRQVTIRCDISPTGFHAAVFSGELTYVIEPASRGDLSAHIVYYKSELHVPQIKCGTTGDLHRRRALPHDSGDVPKTPTQLRTYRLAVIADATYRAQYGGMPYNATNVLNSFASGMNLVNAVYERDLGVHLTLVSNVVCANAVLTGHTDIDEVHDFIVATLGSANFDVGHSLLWANTGGVAYLGVICNNFFKGGGFSGANGSFTQLYVDYMAHELGHQFGADHTFASQECGTSELNFRYEPGEGSTIMAYAGVCGAAPSYQNFSDPYFHAASIGQMNAYITADGGCAVLSTPGSGNNAPPVVNAQANITIPRETPFVLVGSATDANSDPLTYSWEQFNGAGTATAGSPNCNSTTHPMFRFRPPTSNNHRVFPQMSDVLAGNNNTPAWEKLPCVARTMNFRLTARDNNVNWGRTASSNMVVTVANTGPFNVTAPNGGESWTANSTQNVTWTVNGTDAHCTNVDVLISTDNGVTYSVLGTFPNNGSASVTMPGTASATARVLVQCSVGGNFLSASTFFDVSNAVFSITDPAPCSDLRISQVYGGGGNTYTHDYVELYNGGSTAVSLNGLSIQYTSATGTGNFGSSTILLTELPNVMIQPGRYFLIQQAAGSATTPLPTPDHIDPTPINLSATAGKVALVNSTTSLGCNGSSTLCNPTQLALIIDLVGYGTANFFEGTGPAPTPSNTTAILRTGNGCTDNNNNSSDFVTGTPNPRNSASPVNNCGLVLTITDNVCPSTTGTISASGCGTGTVLEYATNATGPWSTTAPTYTTSAITVYVRCRNTTTDCSGPIVSGTTAPTACSTCPDLSTAPGEVQITNSACTSNCTVTGGNIAAPAVGCPAGSTLQYSVNGGTWSSTLPIYNTNGPAQTIQTRCECDTDTGITSPASTGVTTVPGSCTTPNAPMLTITDNVCPSTTGTISATGCGAGTVVEYATNPGGPWSDTAPAYTETAFTVYARCRNTTTDCVSANVSETTDPTACPPSFCNTYASALNLNIDIPNNGSISSTINVAATANITELKCVTVNMTHTFTGDLAVTLTHVNSGTAVQLFRRVNAVGSGFGENSNLDGSYTFCATGASFADAGLALSTSEIIPPGVYAQSSASGQTVPPENFNTYANFTGLNVNGDWTLQIADYAIADIGTLRDWSFEVCTDEPICPTFSGAPANVSIVNSSCGSGCTLSGGSITAPTGTPCPAGSTLQYQVDGGSWSATLPTYNQAGPAQSIKTRCVCEVDENEVSEESSAVTTVPGTLANPVVPVNGSSTVACLALATQPTPPGVTACDGSSITPSGPVITDSPDPLTCEGVRTYTWTYSCGTTSAVWSFIYTIEHEPFTMPANGASTVACLSAAVAPTLPMVTSNCGEPLTPSGPVITDSPGTLTCEGTRTYAYTYTDCEGNTGTWSFIYTIEREPFAVPGNGAATVNDTALAIAPSLPMVLSNCGEPLTPSEPVITNSPNPLTCTGTRTYAYTYTDCEGNTATWSFVYTIINNTPPMVTCSNSSVVFNGQPSIPLNVNSLATAIDNCGPPTLTLSPSVISCEQIGQVVPVIVTATDANNNAATCTSQITVTGLPCGWSQNPDGVNCANGNSISYNPAQAWTATSTNCYYASPFTSDATAFAQRTLCGDGITASDRHQRHSAWLGGRRDAREQHGGLKAQLTTNLSALSRREFRTTTNGTAMPQQFPSQDAAIGCALCAWAISSACMYRPTA
ncbi:MAG: lamin tail domain-containing protein [Saprospiraceae bacterium]|nr:lamin tail domain-containing protein [Saprospiraceae bacterium]